MMPARKRIRIEVEATARDFAMARLAAARASATAMIEAIDDCLNLFVDPEDDISGKERKELVDSALEAAGCSSRALESAEEMFKHVDMNEVEPWDEGDDEGDE
jgi:predicted ATP-grasp superfamily ATP-dependent carboligase